MALYRIGNLYLNQSETNQFFNMVVVGMSFGLGLVFGMVSASYAFDYLELSREFKIGATLVWSLGTGALFVSGRRMLVLVFSLVLTLLCGGAFLYVLVGIIASIFR